MNIWLAKITPEDSRGLIFGWALTAKSLGWIVALLVSGLVAWQWGMRWVFCECRLLFAPNPGDCHDGTLFAVIK